MLNNAMDVHVHTCKLNTHVKKALKLYTVPAQKPVWLSSAVVTVVQRLGLGLWLGVAVEMEMLRGRFRYGLPALSDWLFLCKEGGGYNIY